jgi:hypothetical protein
MKRTQKWEGVGPYVWGSRLMQDAATRQFGLWYITYDYNGNMYRWGYATSRDGLAWNKPDLGGGQRVGGELARNLLPLGPHPEKGARTIARDPRANTPPERRYLGIRFTYDGVLASFSPDGLRWTESPHNPVWHVPSDIIHLMFDDRRQKFVAYFKLWEVAGTEINPSGEEKPFVAYMPTFKPTEMPETKRAKFEGPVVHFHPNAAATVAQQTFILRSDKQGKDDGGGSSLSGAWTGKRVQTWAESDDGVHWTKEQLVMRADDKDPPTANIQYLFVIQHGGYYLGFATLHDESGEFRIQLAHSPDGVKWKRPWRTPWLDTGPAGAFDSNMVLGPGDPIVWEREMWFPYGGFPIPHDSTDQNWEAAIGMATTRLDGFAAWRSAGAADAAGELVTRPFKCDGDRLFVNADARDGGHVSVEVLGEDGKPVAGYEASACRPLKGDTFAEGVDGWVRWDAKQNLKDVQGNRVQLRFIVKNADLFSFRVADAKTEVLRVPRATQR